ncbi:hypothetical protein ACIPD2_14550 [Streptomyces griseofuscus]|uniref:hypothetical protein n=1 Tax=Streptomyces griseofuscus TaxID=146922 RepID=UPI0038154345
MNRPTDAYGEGSLPAAIVAAVGAGRTVEVGTALGYMALAMAHAAPGARVETIEIDPDQVRLAREQISAHRVVRELHRLLRIGGTLISGNLILGPDRVVTSHLGDTSRDGAVRQTRLSRPTSDMLRARRPAARASETPVTFCGTSRCRYPRRAGPARSVPGA